MNSQSKCPTCSKRGTLAPGVTEHASKVGPRVFVATLPAMVCSNCGEALVADEDFRAFEHVRARAVVASGASDGAAVRVMRKASRLSGVELARLLGVAPETVSRWEHDAQAPDRAAVALIGSLALEAMEGRTSTHDRLVAFNAARPAGGEPERVVLQVVPTAA